MASTGKENTEKTILKGKKTAEHQQQFQKDAKPHSPQSEQRIISQGKTIITYDVS